LDEERKPQTDNRTWKASRRVAREARRRIELVASRLPRTALFKSGRGAVEEADRVVVVSDTHFGDPFDVLTSSRAIEALTDRIESLGAIDELVLLGDVFDFWKSPFGEAIARSRDFMSALFMLENVKRIVYLPGNHDHHVFRQYYNEQVTESLRRGVVEPPELTMPLTADCPIMNVLKPRAARVPLFAVYPAHNVNVRGTKVLLTHGHMLGFFERSLWRPRQSRISTLLVRKSENLDLEEMERFISPFYEMMALSALVPGVLEGNYRVYRFLARTGKVLGLQGESRDSTYRDTTVEQNAAEIEALLDHFCEEKPDYFIYGHTHRAGRLELPISGTTAINSGCWLGDSVTEDSRNIILEITDEARLIEVEF
jgi:UDP-2,3-diacylglucosamine pyrophosphatase LpxH